MKPKAIVPTNIIPLSQSMRNNMPNILDFTWSRRGRGAQSGRRKSARSTFMKKPASYCINEMVAANRPTIRNDMHMLSYETRPNFNQNFHPYYKPIFYPDVTSDISEHIMHLAQQQLRKEALQRRKRYRAAKQKVLNHKRERQLQGFALPLRGIHIY